MTNAVEYNVSPRMQEVGPSYYSEIEEVMVRCNVAFIYQKLKKEDGSTLNIIKTLELVAEKLVIDNPDFNRDQVDEAIFNIVNVFSENDPTTFKKSIKSLSKLQRVKMLKDKYSYLDTKLGDQDLIDLDNYMQTLE